MMRRFLFLCNPPQLLVFLLCLQLGFSELPPDQVSTMIRVYESIHANAGKASSPCLWKGVSCSPDNSTIQKLSFKSFSISTSDFLPLLCSLTSLESLDVSVNGLSSIPNEFFAGSCGVITGLKVLNFSNNKLNGVLPAFSGFRMLEHLDLSFNSLSGDVDLQLNGLNSLKSLNLSYNKLTGTVPISRGNFSLLENLRLSANSFAGHIPAEITKCRNLRLIDLGINFLSGTIPGDMGDLTILETLLLSINNLTGEIPVSISRITTLTRFAANQNNFTGRLPTGITSHLQALDLSFNKLGGEIPPDLLSGPKLWSIDLSYNDLHGSIPVNISKTLFRVRLGNNSLGGTIPGGSLGNLMELMYLELDGNFLSGGIPSELGMCRNLALLNLAQNKLIGPLPPALGNLTNLQGLHLQGNNFAGAIPHQITYLNRLLELNLNRNSLSGSIPASISSLKMLTHLDLQNNNLSGSIPDSIEGLTSLMELQLGKNRLGGQIPRMPIKLEIALNLSYNLFDGPIPESLSRLENLQILDLSHNRFSGRIPESLTRITTLIQLVLSNNDLSGVAPNFGKHVDFVYQGGNEGLIVKQNPNQVPKQKKKSLASVVAIAVASAAMAVGLFILTAILVLRRYHRINDERMSSEEETSPPQQIAHGKLLTLNSIHRANIDFRKAMEAVADIANIRLRTRFSTYYKAVMPSGTSYFVKKLNWSDKIFQLGNHEKFGEELEVVGKLCNSNVMIPLAYVLTANSAYLFYDFTPKGTLSEVLHHRISSTLDWASRYSIAIGVSQGMAFLHECSSGAILLLDLSSKSIMLKTLNEPQIGDIELCKVIDPSKSTSSLSTIAGSVGYVPPEYAYTMRVTAAGNVYSFGVVLLELLTGKQAVSGGTELAKWVQSNTARHNRWDQILDASISKMSVAVRSQMVGVLKVALACVSITPDARPKMKSVLRMLLNAR